MFDRFELVMGTRRGRIRRHGSDDDSEAPWWHWGRHHPRLAAWLEKVANAGYVDLTLIDRGTPNHFELRALHQDSDLGYAGLNIDGGEALWLEDHWPEELILSRDETHSRGWLLPPAH